MTDDKLTNTYRSKTILVTGGVGAIGSNLVRALSKLDAKEIIVLDNLSASKKWNLPNVNNVRFVEGSIVDESCLKFVFSKKPSLVFHLAAFFANQNSVDYPERDLEVNGLGTLKLLQYSELSKVNRFVYASSGCSIYGSTAPLPLKEDFVSMQLTTPYQITKMLGELYANFFINHYEMDIVKARFFNSYGPGEIPGQYRNVIPNFIYWALKKKSLPITGDGRATRDFTFVDDLVNGLLLLGHNENARGQEFNLAGGREIEIGYLAEVINKLTNNPGGIHFSPTRKWDTKKRLLASIEKAQNVVGYSPSMNFEDGLLKTIQWFNDNWHEIDSAADFPPGIYSALPQK